MPFSRALRRRVSNWLLEGGALLAIVAGGYQFIKDALAESSAQRDACRRADEMILDNDLNGALTLPQKRVVLERKLRLSQLCDKEAMP